MIRLPHASLRRSVGALLCALALAASWLSVTVEGHARPTQAQRASAREHANEGRDLFNQEKYQESIEQFREAEKLVHAPPHLLYIARALSKIGKLVEAAEAYRQIVAEKLDSKAPVAFMNSQEAARTELAALEQRIPKITVDIIGPSLAEATVTIDGVPTDAAAMARPLPLDPGEHQVAAEAAGYRPERKDFELSDGEGLVEIQLVLAPLDTAAPTGPGEDETAGDGGLSVPPFVLLGVGVAILAVGGVTGGLALGKADELKQACPTNPCPTSNESLADDANLLATISTVGFIAGGLTTAAGVTWLIWDLASPGDEEDRDSASWRVQPYAGPGAVGVRGQF